MSIIFNIKWQSMNRRACVCVCVDASGAGQVRRARGASCREGWERVKVWDGFVVRGGGVRDRVFM